MKKIVIILIFLVPSVIGLFTVNYLMLGKPMEDVLKSDPRNSGIHIAAHYKYYLVPSVLVLDMKEVSSRKSPADVFRVLLQYASEIQKMEFDKVSLNSKGKAKFILKGNYFRELGKEYGLQNPVYTMRTFPENVYTLNGQKAFPSWTGGLLGVTGKQVEDFTEFHKQWYIDDLKDSYVYNY